MSKNYLFLIDVTASMGQWINAINECLPPLIRSTALTGIFDKIGILSYGDYDYQNNIFDFSGFCSSSNIAEIEKLQKFARNLIPRGGNGQPEAVKTALYSLVKFAANDNDHLYILHLTDAPPHIIGKNLDDEGRKEQKVLEENFDWITMTDKLITACPNINYSCLSTHNHQCYCHLAQKTGGNVCSLEGGVSASNVRKQIGRFMNGLFGLDDPIQGRKVISNLNVQNETELMKNLITTTNDPFVPNKLLSGSLALCLKRLRTDNDFLEHVISEFNVIIEQTPMALTISPILGKMWRDLCKRRSDPRRDELIELLNKRKGSIGLEDRTILEEWLKESYNARAEIDDEIRKFISENEVNGLLRFVPEDNFLCAQQIVQLLASGDKKAVTIIRSILSRLYVDNDYKLAQTKLDENDDIPLPDGSIPLNLPTFKLFELAMHTVAPGTKLTRRYSCLLACYAIQCGSVIAPRAKYLLEKTKGRWINWKRRDDETPEVPENYSNMFLNLILHPECVTFLTDEEQINAKFMKKVANALRFFHNNEITVEVVDHTSIDGSFPDNEFNCFKCNHPRPMTLINGEGICGYCCSDCPVDYGLDNEYIQVRCHDCGHIYTREKVAYVPGYSKCYSCRNLGKSSPSVKCNRCKLDFVQYFMTDKGLPKGTCGACAKEMDPRKLQYKQFPTLIHQVFADHFGTLCSSIGLTMATNFKSNMPLYQAVRYFKESDPVDVNVPNNILFRETNVCNVSDLWEYIKGVMKGAFVTLPDCSVCFDQFSPSELVPACGRKGCIQRVCVACSKSWYGKNTPGNLIYQRATMCQFCSRVPAPQVLDRIDRRLVNLAFSIANHHLDMDAYYGWCTVCFKPHEIARHECAVEAPTLSNFKCPSCQNQAPEVKAKPCPSCTTMVEKIGGCNHIKCNCGAHWCFECSTQCESYDATYKHMWDVHGRIFDYDAPNYDNDDDVTDDDY
jgi:IBR domain